MRWYKGPEGDERLWLEPSEIEQIMEDELRKAELWPTSTAPAVDIEAFVENHLRASLDQHAPLDPDVLGLTEFRTRQAPVIKINRDLTGSAMDAEWSPPGVLGRWRATLAHEATHVVIHGILFELNPDQGVLFGSDQPAASPRLFRCLKRDVSASSSRGDWREIQANRGMAALLMPKPMFLDAATDLIGSGTSESETLIKAASTLAGLFQVSRESASIRLKTLGFDRRSGGSRLFADEPPETRA